MALFKISKGSKSNLPSTLTEGYCWYTFEDSKFYIDHKDENGVLVRKALNAQDAATLCGKSLEELKNEIATQDAVVLAEAQAYTDAVISNIELPDLSGLETESRDIVGAINEINGKTLDKISCIDTYFDTEAYGISTEDGITWSETFEISGGDISCNGEIYQRVPIVAGNNVTFEVDQGVVKINAKSITVDDVIAALPRYNGEVEDV